MKIKITVDGKELSVPKFTKISDVLEKENPKYEDNPIVGALANGQLLPLSAPMQISCTLEPVRAFSTEGRRIYRHSICFLLCYATKLVFPKRHLVIGHSLGDGYYFHFDDCYMTNEDTIRRIEEEMWRLVKAALPIEKTSLPYQSALEYFTNNGFEDTALLLSSGNAPVIDLYKINDYYDIAYEPIVPNTSLLGVWDLMFYGDNGMLLRYPRRDSINEICAFHDNPLLFKVFEEYKVWGKLLQVQSIGQMNDICTSTHLGRYIRLAEALHRRKIASIADSIADRPTRAVFISGPSSSGKTTFSKRLAEQLILMDFEPLRISLDDYYMKKELVELDEDGKPDFENIKALRLDLFDKNIRDLLDGKEVDLPQFSFKDNETYYLNKPVKMNSHSILVIEGIHALNPRITGVVESEGIFRVYISALSQLNMDDHNRISTTDNRMLRRMVRDNKTRNLRAARTLAMWPSVSRGEKNHIFPYQNNADVMFNSALDYELGVLAPMAQPLLKEVKPDGGEAYTTARRLLEFVSNIHPIPGDLVPSDSLLREFIGGSDYENEP